METVKILWGGLLCFIGIHDGEPEGEWVTCERCGKKMLMSRVIKIVK